MMEFGHKYWCIENFYSEMRLAVCVNKAMKIKSCVCVCVASESLSQSSAPPHPVFVVQANIMLFYFFLQEKSHILHITD